MPWSRKRRVDDDPALNRRAAAGDQRAFAELVGRHEAGLRSFLMRVAGAAADDIAQEAFLRAWRRAAQFDGRGSYAAWLRAIGWRTFLDRHRHDRSRQRTIAEVSIVPDAADTGIEARIDATTLLAALDPLERACITLCLGEGRSHREAAEILAMPLGSLKTRLARAVRQCRAMLE